MKSLRPAIKCHGGKFYLSSWILQYFPENYREMDYVEPFIGGASVFLNKERPANGIEVINDLNPGIANIYRMLRDDTSCFVRKLREIRYSEKSFQTALRKKESKSAQSDFAAAVTEFVLRRMSRGGLGKTFSWSKRKRGGKPEGINCWQTILKELPRISERLQGTYIFNKSALEVVYAFNAENVLLYCDPPYLHDTRTVKEAYDKFEMTTEDHVALANLLLKFKGKVILSGYQSALYKRLFKDWRAVKKSIANHSGQSKKKETRVEYLWMNF